MAAMQEFNVSEDEIHEYVYPEEAQPEENGNEYQDDQQADDEEEAEESMEDSTSDAVEVCPDKRLPPKTLFFRPVAATENLYLEQ